LVIRRKGTGSIVAFVAPASQSGRDLKPAWERTRWWLFGAFAAFGLLYAVTRMPLVFPLIIAVLVVLALRSPERAAFGGGAMVPTGLWFLYQLRAAVDRCAEMDRSPSGSCAIYGVEEQALAMGLYVAVGIGLTAYAVLRPRLSRA
jgi:hypothetical protein